MKIICNILVCFILSTSFAMGAGAPSAKQSNAEMIVTATVQKYCNIISSPFSFGDYHDLSVTAEATVTVTCTNGTPYYISVSRIDNALVDENNDVMVYSVYQNEQRSKAVGNTFNQNTISGVGTGLPETITLYAQITSTEAIAPGTYEGKLHVTLSF